MLPLKGYFFARTTAGTPLPCPSQARCNPVAGADFERNNLKAFGRIAPACNSHHGQDRLGIPCPTLLCRARVQKDIAIFWIISLALLINSVFTCLNTIPYQLAFLIASLGNRWAFAAFFEGSLEKQSLAQFIATLL